MKSDNQLVALLWISALFVTACSSSSSTQSSPSDIELSPENDSTNPIDVSIEEPQETNTADSSTQDITLVQFEIMVPAYQSDALKVAVSWGGMELNASWLGDEAWSVMAELPTNTEHLLSVTFYDDNGLIELGTFETQYRTGITFSESLQISAEQFDTNRWDADADGISNFDELLAAGDPAIQNITQVNFEITVPAYQSNQLRVELDWGDVSIGAMWVGDELWTASGEFPTSTQHLLSVTFYDLNGDIELARFSQLFTTGSNAAESLQIPAEQFDSDIFDTDEDGTNNLNESIAGTNPLIDELALLPIRDTFNHSQWSRMSISRHFESHLSDERPFIDTLTLSPQEGYDIYRDAIIDEDGNGTLTYNIWAGSTSLNITGTRTVSEGSVSWEGIRTARDDYTHRLTVNNTVTYIDANTRAFVEEVEGSNSGTYTDTWETSSNLIGRLIEGTSLCEPIAGTVTTTQRSNRGDGDNYTFTISKGVEDQYWRVGSGTNGYFVRDLIMLRSYCGTRCGSYTEPELDDQYFTCDFVDY